MLQVQVAPKAFLTRLKTITPFVGRRWPKPILETVQFEATAERRGLLRATDLEAFVAVEVPLIKVITPGRVQLPRDKLCRILKEANGSTVTLEEVAPETSTITTQPGTTHLRGALPSALARAPRRFPPSTRTTSPSDGSKRQPARSRSRASAS